MKEDREVTVMRWEEDINETIFLSLSHLLRVDNNRVKQLVCQVLTDTRKDNWSKREDESEFYLWEMKRRAFTQNKSD